MASRNDITGDSIATKNTSDSFRDGWDRIFSKKNQTTETKKEEQNDQEIRSTTEGD